MLGELGIPKGSVEACSEEGHLKYWIPICATYSSAPIRLCPTVSRSLNFWFLSTAMRLPRLRKTSGSETCFVADSSPSAAELFFRVAPESGDNGQAEWHG